MALVLGYDIPYLGYISSGIGSIITVIIIWNLLRNRGEDRIDIANKEIEEDKELLELHRNQRRIEKTERSDAEELLDLFNNVYSRARAIGYHPEQEDYRTNWIRSTLYSIVREKMSIKGEVAQFKTLSSTMLYYLTRLGEGDNIINFYRTNIEKYLHKLGVDIEEEYRTIEQSKGVLKDEELNRQREEAA